MTRRTIQLTEFLSGTWMVTWIRDKQSGNWMAIRHLWIIRPFSYRTCLITKCLLYNWTYSAHFLLLDSICVIWIVGKSVCYTDYLSNKRHKGHSSDHESVPMNIKFSIWIIDYYSPIVRYCGDLKTEWLKEVGHQMAQYLNAVWIQ